MAGIKFTADRRELLAGITWAAQGLPRTIHQLPGYEDAPWEVHNADDVMVGAATTVRGRRRIS